MADCCEDKSCALDALQKRQASTLKAVLWINAVMFFVVLAMGIYAGSTALLSDALDNLGDALTFAMSLYAVGKSIRTKSRVALFKGVLILAAGIGVLAQVLYKSLHPETPIYEVMGATSLVALAANGACLWLLWSHRDEDVNMSSVWHCSRNDIAANLSVLVAAAGVWLVGSPWPDLVVGFALGVLFLCSAAKVLRAAIRALDAPEVARQI
ncbi:MAG TPA: cation transporter [Burkholderiales bacterium]|jgi:cation diffusion facilitator family transporter